MTDALALHVSPDGFWLKTHIYQEGYMLHAVTYSSIAGSPEIFKASVDLRPIAAFVAKKHNELHATKVSGEDLIGFSFGDFTKPFASIAKSAAAMVNKVGKSKLVSQIGSTVKDVVKSKITGAALTGLAVVFPPVGAPAVAAYAAANVALSAIEQGKAAVDAAKKIVDRNTPPAVKNALKSALTKWSGAEVQKAIAAKIPMPTGPGGKSLSTVAQAVKLASAKAAQAKKTLAVINEKAKHGDVEAAKMARIVNLAHSAHTQLKSIKKSTSKNLPRVASKRKNVPLNGFPAILVSNRGHIIPGRYIEKTGGTPGTILRGGKVFRGNFAAVSGDFMGCIGISDDDDLMRHRPAVGCANPFMKPAQLR